jgi:hypothetical protein
MPTLKQVADLNDKVSRLQHLMVRARDDAQAGKIDRDGAADTAIPLTPELVQLYQGRIDALVRAVKTDAAALT